MSSVQHANLGFPNRPFQGFSEYTPYTPPPPFTGHIVGTNQATVTTTTENPPSWRIRYCPREIFCPLIPPPPLRITTIVILALQHNTIHILNMCSASCPFGNDPQILNIKGHLGVYGRSITPNFSRVAKGRTQSEVAT